MDTITPYIKRPVKFIKQVEFAGWRLKIYGISAVSKPVPNELIVSIIDKIQSHLPKTINVENCYGVGFLIIHAGVLRNWFLLDWWGYEDVLFHKLFSSPLNNSNLITLENESSIIACVHELRVINFESNAWITTILNKDFKPNLDEYMNHRLDEYDIIN
jgi:hypothetical protein